MRRRDAMPIFLAATLALGGCMGGSTPTADPQPRQSVPAGAADDYRGYTFTKIGTQDLAWPLTPASAQPISVQVKVPGNTTVLRLRAEFSSDAPGSAASSHPTQLVGGDAVAVRIAWRDGASLASLSPAPILTVAYPSPFASVQVSKAVNVTEPQMLDLDVQGWGNMRAQVVVYRGVPDESTGT